MCIALSCSQCFVPRISKTSHDFCCFRFCFHNKRQTITVSSISWPWMSKLWNCRLLLFSKSSLLGRFWNLSDFLFLTFYTKNERSKSIHLPKNVFTEYALYIHFRNFFFYEFRRHYKSFFGFVFAHKIEVKIFLFFHFP